MREKVVPAVFLMLVLLIGFPSSAIDFSAFADDDDDYDDDRHDDEKGKEKKENKNLKVSAEESKAYKKQKEKAEEAREKAQERKDKLKKKYDEEIEELREKAKKVEKEKREKYERELKKFEEKVNRLDKDDDDDDYDDDHITEFSDYVEIDYSSKTLVLCHYPPGNPDNAKSITIGTKAARAHVYNHGDTIGECSGDIDLDLGEREYNLAKKQQKLAELRSKFAQKQIELAEKFSDKIAKLEAKYAEKEAKRAAKLAEKFESGDYYKHFIKDQAPKREFVLSFGELNSGTLIADPIGHSAEVPNFSGSITLITSSSTDTRGTTQFKVASCNLDNGVGDSFECKYGKARTSSSGPGGLKDNFVIIATFDDENGKRTGLKLSVSTDVDIRTLEDEENLPITVLSPQSKITHQWFLGGPGTMSVGPVTESTEESNGT